MEDIRDGLNMADWVLIAGINARNPITGADTGWPQIFVATRRLVYNEPLSANDFYPSLPLQDVSDLRWDRLMLYTPAAMRLMMAQVPTTEPPSFKS